MRLMIVGSLNGQISTAGKIAIGRGAKVTHTEDVEQALGALRAGKGADLLMVDVKQDIAGLVEQLKAERFVVPVVACGIGTDAASAVRAIKAGAKEYIPLPPNAELIAAVLQAVAEESNAMIANDPSMKAVLQVADRVAPSEATILVTGESGTGKEVMSRYIHQKSRRAGGPFISLNCAAIPESLLESELFGHEKGAFTGAVTQKLGRFEAANGGTLFLDEIGDIPLELQAKLLRVLQEQEFERLGSTFTRHVDVRVVAATNQDLAMRVSEKQFRIDLYYRLNVFPISLPPLRLRPDDIPRLVAHFVQKYSARMSKRISKVSKDAMQALQRHSWPGNVRELQNVIERAVILTNGDILQVPAPPSRLPVPTETMTLANAEREHILHALEESNWVVGGKAGAAAGLGLKRTTLVDKMRRSGLSREAAHGVA
jgi:DNA-binding NtrC family response regulator